MSLLNTRLLELRSASPNLDKWTNRPSMYGAFDCFQAGNEEPESIISPELFAQAARAVGRDVKVPVFDSESVSIGSTRSVTIADSENTSQLYTVSFTTYSWGFTSVPSLYLNNEIGQQQDWNRKFLKYLYKFAETLDTAGISALGTAKSQVFANLLGLYTNVANTVVAPLAQRDEIIGDLSPIMGANDFYGAPYRIVGEMGLQSRILKMSEQSIYNEKDKTIQWLDKRFHWSNRLTNSAGHIASGFIVNPGSVGLLFRHEAEALLGTILPNGTEWQIDTLPLLDIPIDTYFYYGVSDESSLAGAASAHLTRAAKEHYGFSIDVAFVTAYNTALATYASPIVRFAIANA